MRLPRDLLDRSPEEAARRIALGLLAGARAASARLEDARDEEALHDFRVAVRRLRSTLRHWRDVLGGSLKKRHRRGLRDLQVATGGGRDAEVALLWLERQRPALEPPHRRGLDWLAARLRRRLKHAMAEVRRSVRADFARIDADLGRRLEEMRRRIDPREEGPAARFGPALGRRARAQVQALRAHLGRVRRPTDRDEAHAARISGKRLRYLLEPVRARVPAAAALVRRLKRLQDVLGDLNDAHVLGDEIGAALEEASCEGGPRPPEPAREALDARGRDEASPPPRSALQELTRRLDEHGAALHARLVAKWKEGGLDRLVRDVTRMAEDLERGGVEVERKFLLGSRPTLPPGAAVLEVEQGWLPGERLRERLRREREGDRVRFLRTLKTGRGVRRLEIEEETSADLFAALWPLTEGCRVRKRRYRVEEAGRVWEIDEFLDRPLFLAEVELREASEPVVLPGWLAPHVVREVTEEEAFTNLALAR